VSRCRPFTALLPLLLSASESLYLGLRPRLVSACAVAVCLGSLPRCGAALSCRAPAPVHRISSRLVCTLSSCITTLAPYPFLPAHLQSHPSPGFFSPPHFIPPPLSVVTLSFLRYCHTQPLMSCNATTQLHIDVKSRRRCFQRLEAYRGMRAIEHGACTFIQPMSCSSSHAHPPSVPDHAAKPASR